MKKIMFNDRYGLTAAVLQGCKTMTRRVIPEKIVNHFEKQYGEVDVKHNKEYQTFTFFNCSAGSKPEDHLWVPCRILEPLKAAPYKIGEEIAVAQCYEDIWKQMVDGEAHANQCYKFYREHQSSAGWNNKMYVRADLMPHRIRITDIKVERLQDISDTDSRKEGMIPVTWRQYLKQDWDDLSPQKYIDHDVWTLPIFKDGILDPWAESHPDEFMADKPSTAFNVLIRKMMGVKKWESNPWVFAYSFELID